MQGSRNVYLRNYQAGDEAAQLKIYNAAAAPLPKFKPANIQDLWRRISARDFDPTTRVYAELGGDIVGYCTYQANGRVGYPWCLPGFELAAEPLFEHIIRSMKQRGFAKAFTAYRKDWPVITEFFQNHGFRQAREMVNYILAFENLPTPSARPSSSITPATPEDIPAIYALDPTVFRVPNARALAKELLQNPWYPPESVFVSRDRDGSPQAAGLFITNASYADARMVDPAMPCFRLGAFGTEGMTTKRIRGLFSFVTRPDRNIHVTGMDLLSHAIRQIRDEDDIANYAAQVASDATALHAFYERIFERQGSFPIHERDL